MAPEFLLTQPGEDKEILGNDVDQLFFHHAPTLTPDYQEQLDGSLLVRIPEQAHNEGQTAVALVASDMGLQVKRVENML